MEKEHTKVNFSQLVGLNSANAALLPGKAGLYMICKKDKNNNNQVIFAGVAPDLKLEFNNHLAKNNTNNNLLFCYTLTNDKSTIKNTEKALYHRVA